MNNKTITRYYFIRGTVFQIGSFDESIVEKYSYLGEFIGYDVTYNCFVEVNVNE